MDIGVISVRYARSLLKGAIAEKQEDTVYQNMQSLMNCYLHIRELRPTIDNPMFPKERKQEMIKMACGTDVCALTDRFVALVLQKGREDVLQFMAVSYITLYRAYKHIIRGRLITATAVSPDMEQKMREMVQNRTLGTVEFEAEVNPDILGGFILEYDSFRMDASVQTKLNSILKQLKK